MGCENLSGDLASLPTAVPKKAVVSPPLPTPTITAPQAKPTDPTLFVATVLPEPTATPIGRKLSDAARPTSTPAPTGSESFLDAADNTGLVKAPSAFSNTQTSGPGRFAITIDGSGPDLLESVQGGFIWAEVVDSGLGGDRSSGKSLSSINYEPFDIEFDMAMSDQFYEWIEDALDGESQPVVGEVLAVGVDFGELSTRRFLDAYIKAITFPVLDASSKDLAYLAVTIKPEFIDYDGESNGLNEVSPPLATAGKSWLASNFRIEIGDLPTQRVSKIDSFTW